MLEDNKTRRKPTKNDNDDDEEFRKSGMINEPTFIEEGVRNLKILFQFDSVVTSMREMSLGIPKLSLPHYHAIKLKR